MVFGVLLLQRYKTCSNICNERPDDCNNMNIFYYLRRTIKDFIIKTTNIL